MTELKIPTRPALPSLVRRKLYKTGQTRGATGAEIFQNRVGRNSTVLIPYEHWEKCSDPCDGSDGYENGYIVLVSPSWYMSCIQADSELEERGLRLGDNALLFFQKRSDWQTYALREGAILKNGEPFTAATSRIRPLGGTYVARIPSNTARDNSGAIIAGFNLTDLRGAGIRVYEYASTYAILAARVQLESLFWMCSDSLDAASINGMEISAAMTRKDKILSLAESEGLLHIERLKKVRMLSDEDNTICPLCMEKMKAESFFKRESQAEGRETWNTTTTEVSLFHIEELRMGKLEHRPYNLGWGHHHCNVVVKDAGIIPTLQWLKNVVDRNLAVLTSLEEASRSVEEGLSS